MKTYCKHSRITISIHALREESDSLPVAAFSTFALFQSTLSVRRATTSKSTRIDDYQISIHALREESDPFPRAHPSSRIDFNPRSP